MKTHVIIGTTEGPVAIQRITMEESGVQSVICLNGTVQALPVSGAYNGFVRRGTGVVARDFGHDAYRIDVSDRIDQGMSWQLPVYLAHALFSRNVLGDGQPQPGDRVFWATGEVDVDLCVRPVQGVAEKLARSLDAIQAWRANGIDVQVFLPNTNLGEGSGQIESLAGVSGVSRLLDVVLPLSEGAAAKVRSSSWMSVIGRRWKLALGLIVLAIVLAMSWSWLHGSRSVNSYEKNYELDDFGGRSQPANPPRPPHSNDPR